MASKNQSATTASSAASATASASEAIAIYVRVRAQDGGKSCVAVDPAAGAVTVQTPTGDPRMFTFDFVGGEQTAQEEVFDSVGRPLSEACLAGYNATVFAYGQSGKTHTMEAAPTCTPEPCTTGDPN